MWAGLIVAGVTIVAGVLSLVTLAKHWPPRLDRHTNKRIARSLNRGRLPEDEPDRSAALQLARWRASSHWSVVMLVGLAVGQILLAQRYDGGLAIFAYAVVALLAVAAVLTVAQIVSGRRALRGVIDTDSRGHQESI